MARATAILLPLYSLMLRLWRRQFLCPAKGGFCPDHIDILRPLAGLDIYHNALLHNLQEPLGVEGLPPCSILLDAD